MLLASAMLTVLSTGAHAFEESQFQDMYVKIGGNMGVGVKDSNFGGEFGESTLNPTFGVGFNAMDQVRTEVAFTYINGNPKYEGTSGNIESEGFAVFANGHVDVVEFGMGTLSVMGGLGVSMIETTAEGTSAQMEALHSTMPAAVMDYMTSTELTFKNDFAFSWKLGGNLSFDFSNDAKLEIG